MGQQLTIPNFKAGINITLDDVFRYMRYEDEPVYEEPSNKELRLAIELTKQLNPLFKFNVQEHMDTIRRICEYNVVESKVLNVKSFKQILFKEVIISVKYIGDGKYKAKLKRVRRNINLLPF